jgi:hypothetical protein
MPSASAYLRLDEREYPLRAALKLVEGVTKTPLCDGRGLKHTLERRVFDLARPELGEVHFKQGFVPVAVDRQGLATAVAEVCDKTVFGDLMMALGVSIPPVWHSRLQTHGAHHVAHR